MTPPIIVVGAGIIGTAIAFELQRRGQKVLLLERDQPGRGASFGNMASIAVTEFMPISQAATWRRLPGWLWDRQGPICVRPDYLPKLLPWLWRFLWAGRPRRVAELEAAGAKLCQRVYEDLWPMLAAAGIPDILSEQGCLSVYANQAEFAQDRTHLALLEQYGLPYRVLSKEALLAQEPALSSEIYQAVLFPQNRFVRDPYQLVLSLLHAFHRLGGRVETAKVVDFTCQQGEVRGVRLADGRELLAEKVVLAAGAYTGQLSRLLGEPLPLETERGYHTQIMAPNITLDHALIWPAKAFMVTPTAGGIRVGGSVELAGLQAAPDYRRARTLVQHAKELLPGLQVAESSEWMGHRPALPDTLPIISRSAKVKQLFYATGHGHLGLTYAATTARLLADLVTEQTPPLEMRPYRVDRF